MRMRSLFGLAAVFCLSFQAYAADAKIVFVAGPKDHGRPNRHEYIKDLEALKYCLDNASNLGGLSTFMHTGQVLDIMDQVKDADVVVVESSGDRVERETHAIFPPNAKTDGKSYDAATMAKLEQFDQRMKDGAGLAVLHYATWVDNEKGREYFLDWVGSYHQGQGYSKVLVNPWSVEPAKTNHPVLAGITPWHYDEEFYVAQYLPYDIRRTPLLRASSPEGGEGNVVSWAVQREGGGRGFVMTGMDFHRNLWQDQHRRILLNGIVWAAGMDVPAGGVNCSMPGPPPDAPQ